MSYQIRHFKPGEPIPTRFRRHGQWFRYVDVRETPDGGVTVKYETERKTK